MSQDKDTSDYLVPAATAHGIELFLQQIDASQERQNRRIAHVEAMIREVCEMLGIPAQDYRYDRARKMLVFTVKPDHCQSDQSNNTLED